MVFILAAIIALHTVVFFALTGPISTANMGERGPIELDRFLPSCEMTDLLGPVGVAAGAAVIDPVRSSTALPPVIAAQGLHGSTTLGLIVNESGKVTRACIGTGSGNRDLDSALWADALAWRFTPGTVDGKPAAFRIDVPVTVSPPPQPEAPSPVGRSTDEPAAQ